VLKKRDSAVVLLKKSKGTAEILNLSFILSVSLRNCIIQLVFCALLCVLLGVSRRPKSCDMLAPLGYPPHVWYSAFMAWFSVPGRDGSVLIWVRLQWRPLSPMGAPRHAWGRGRCDRYGKRRPPSLRVWVRLGPNSYERLVRAVEIQIRRNPLRLKFALFKTIRNPPRGTPALAPNSSRASGQSRLHGRHCDDRQNLRN